MATEKKRIIKANVTVWGESLAANLEKIAFVGTFFAILRPR
jgi:hypothetical protein